MILEKPKVVRNEGKSSKISTLPKPKLKKSNLTVRVGISGEWKRKARLITVIDTKTKKTDITEEQSCFDLYDFYDIPMEETIKDLANVNGITNNEGQKDCLNFDFKILEKENPKSGLNKAIAYIVETIYLNMYKYILYTHTKVYFRTPLSSKNS